MRSSTSPLAGCQARWANGPPGSDARQPSHQTTWRADRPFHSTPSAVSRRSATSTRSRNRRPPSQARVSSMSRGRSHQAPAMRMPPWGSASSGSRRPVSATLRMNGWQVAQSARRRPMARWASSANSRSTSVGRNTPSAPSSAAARANKAGYSGVSVKRRPVSGVIRPAATRLEFMTPGSTTASVARPSRRRASREPARPCPTMSTSTCMVSPRARASGDRPRSRGAW